MLIWVACFAALGGFLFGFDLGLIGGALLDITDEFGTSEGVNEVIVGAAKLGAFFGTFLGGALMLYYGRRIAIATDSLFFIVGPLLMAGAGTVAMLVVGRFVVGIGIGVSAVVVPTYLGEVAPAKFRGRVVELYEVLLCVGMVASMLADAAFQFVPGTWRWMVGVPAIPALIMSLALCLLPESPRWLVIHGKLDDALAVIHRIYTSKQLPQGLQNSNADVNQELLELWSSVEKDKAAAAERRRRQEAAREERHTRVAPLAAAQEGAGGLRFKGGWSRLQDQHGEGAGGSAADLEAAGAGGSQQLPRASPPPLLPPPPPLPPGPQGAADEGGAGLRDSSNGSRSEGEGLVAGGPGRVVKASSMDAHSSGSNLLHRAAHSPLHQQPQQQAEGQEAGQQGDAGLLLGLPPPFPLHAPPPPQQQQAGGGVEPAAAPATPPVHLSSPVSAQQAGELPSPAQLSSYSASPLAGAAAGRMGSGSLSRTESPGVSAEEVLPIPRSLRRIRTRSMEFEVVQEDLKPLVVGGSSSLRPPGGAIPRPPPPRPPLPNGTSLLPAPIGGEGAQPALRGSRAEREGEGGYPYQEGNVGEGASGEGAWWRHASLQARRGSMEPWTARQTLATCKGFWSTMGDMLLDIYIVARGPERGAFRMALWLAFFNQAFASTAIINYAPQVLNRAGVSSHSSSALFASAIAGTKMVGVVLSFLLVDSLGRRPLLLHGSLGCAVSLGLLVAADWLGAVPFLVAGMCAFIFAFSISWAGVFWVLLSEMFSMSVKSPAVSAVTAMLFLTGAISDLVFLSLHSWLGPYCFLVFALIALAGGAYVAKAVPETKGRTLHEVQELLGEGGSQGGGLGASGTAGEGLLAAGVARSAPPEVELMGGRHRRRRGWLRWQ